MTAGLGWEPTFLAVSTLLGEPLDVAASALDEGRAAQLLAGVSMRSISERGKICVAFTRPRLR